MHKLAASRHLFCSSQCCQNFPMIFKTILFRVRSIDNKRHYNNYGWFFIVEWLCRRGAAAGAGQFKSIISGSLSTHTALIMRTFSNFTKTCHLNQTKENWLWFISSCFVSQLCRCRKQQQLRCRPVGARGVGGAMTAFGKWDPILTRGADCPLHYYLLPQFLWTSYGPEECRVSALVAGRQAHSHSSLPKGGLLKQICS